jgi:HAE1 family hydrophobic/amphiphilic exporter-1
MRLWIDPDRLAKLNITVPEVVNAVNAQNTVNPAGKIGAEPVPRGQDFTYAVRAQGRLESEGEFANIVIRANPDGSMVRLSDVARVELGAQTYSMMSRLNGKPSAVLAVYQMPGSNAIEAADGAKELMAQLKQHFPADLDYAVALDTTLAVTEGIHEIFVTLWIALALVIVVVFGFLQGWRATLIPLLAVPVSLVGTFMFFPLFGFSINTLSLFGLVLAIGLVVDDAIVVVEAVEHHIENGMKPRDATLKAMEEVSGPVVAIALILAAVFIPTAFIPGITGRRYQQFAVTIAVSVIISAFNALSLSPALASLLLRPKKEARGPLGRFFAWFNAVFGRATDRYVGVCGSLVRKTVLSLGLLAAMVVLAGLLGMRLPATFLPEEDQGYVYAAMQLPDAASLQRTDAAMKKAEDLILKTPGVEYCTAVAGYNLVSGGRTRTAPSSSSRSRTGPSGRGSRSGTGSSRAESRSSSWACPSPWAWPSPRPPYPASAPRAASPSSWRTEPARTSPSSPRTWTGSWRRPRRGRRSRTSPPPTRHPCRRSSWTSTGTRSSRRG